MTIQRQGDLLNISQLEQLAAANSHSFHSTLAASLPADITHIDIDLSKTNFVDCGGVGALVALRKCVRNCNREVTPFAQSFHFRAPNPAIDPHG